MERAPRGSSPDAQVILPASFAAASLIAQHVAGKATRDSLFLTRFGIEALPAAMIGAALVSSLAMVGTSRALSRLGPARVVPAAFATSAALHAIEAAFAGRFEGAVAVAVYVHAAVFGSAAVSAFWSLMNESFDPHAAKRAVGRIAAGGTVGGVVGGLVVWQAAPLVPVQAMLGLLAVTNLVGLAGTLRVLSATARRASAGRATPPPPTPPSRATGGESAVRLLARTPYLRDLALLVLSGAVLQALLDWLLSARAAALYAKGPPLLGFFALYNMIVGVASFVAQTGLSRPLLERLGLGRTARLQPVVTAVFATLALVFPGPASVFALRGAEAVTRNSFFRSAYELFYTPLPAAKKRPTKALVDVGFDRLGTTLGSLALLAVATLGPDAATRIVLVGTLLASAAAIAIGSRLQAGYVAALADSLKSGAVALGDDDLVDLTTRRTLAETTALLDRDKLLARIEEFHRERGSSVPGSDGAPAHDGEALEVAPRSRRSSELPLPPLEPSVVLGDALLLRIAALRSGDHARVRIELAAPISPELAPFVVPLLGKDAVARDAVRALRRAGVSVAGMLVDRLLDPRTEAVVRRRIPRVLRAAPGELAVRGLVRALRDPAFEVRQQAAVALAHVTSHTATTSSAAVVLDRAEIFEVARDELGEGRRSWGPEPARGVGHVFPVLGLVLDREPLTIALRALRGDDPVLRGTAHEYLEVVLPPAVRAALEPLLGTALRASEPRPPRELAEELLRSHARLPAR